MRQPHFHVFGVPVRVELWFWLSGAFIGARYSSLKLAGLWMAILFGSILLHEMGHAMAYRRYGATPSVTLHGMGGVTYSSDAGHLTAKQRIFVSSAGSVTEMALLGGPAWLLQQAWNPYGYLGIALTWLIYINVFWALVNLAPVWPMDGGQILDDAIFVFTGQYQRRFVHTTSIVFAVGLSIYFLTSGLVFAALLFGYQIVINLGRLGIVGSSSVPAMDVLGGAERPVRSSGTTRVDQRKARRQRNQTAVLLAALSQNKTDRALQLSAQTLKTGSAAERAVALEAVVWAWLQQNRLDRASKSAEALTSPSPVLLAVLLIEEGSDLEGVEALAEALVARPKDVFAETAIAHTLFSGHLVLLAQSLSAMSTPVARGHLVRIDSFLEHRQIERERRAIAQLI